MILSLKYHTLTSIYDRMFHKVKTEHHILKEFHPFLKEIEKIPEIQRIIPWRIVREQSWRSSQRINFSYPTPTGLKYKLCKWSTAQEIFVIVKQGSETQVQATIENIITHYHK